MLILLSKEIFWKSGHSYLRESSTNYRGMGRNIFYNYTGAYVE